MIRRRISRLLQIGLIFLCLTGVIRADAETPRFVSLSAQPAALTLDGKRDTRSILVTGITSSGVAIDLTESAKIAAQSSLVTIDSDGMITPVRAGRTSLVVTAGGRNIVVPVVVRNAADAPVSFVREVKPILSKTGCTAGTCHGAAKGKNGFKLSLRGYDADYDYHALVDDVGGRRFNRAEPSQSLMLLKPDGGVPHKGGMLFNAQSRQYRMIERWIREGVRNDAKTTPRVASLEILPAVPNLTLPGMTQKTLVLAHYPDGTVRDVTRDAVFTSSNPDVALTTPGGKLKSVRRGEAALLVRYEGAYAAAPLTVIGDRTGYVWKPAPQFNYVDTLVDKKLQKVKTLPSSLCDDAAFMRRVSIDLTGLPPTPEAVRVWLADKTSGQAKRQKLIGKLLASPEFDERWTNKWADLLSANSKFLGDAGVRKYRNWIASAVAANKPYNQFVRELVTASGDSADSPASCFYRVNRDTSQATENVTQLFLGVRFSCNKCHDHPFEKWTQNQYYQFGAFFAQVGYKGGQLDGAEVVFNKETGEVMHPKTGLVVAPAVPVGKIIPDASQNDRRELFAAWLTSPDNPFFSRAMVNRLWSYFLGKGIIDPVDDIRASNPASNPELLEALNRDFVHSGFDIKHIMRVIVSSRTYQAAITTNRWNADDGMNFSHAMPRRLEAEQLLDAIRTATGTVTHFEGLPAGAHATALPDAATSGGDGFLALFGKPPRETPCECERVSNVSLGQALNLINGPTISDAIASPDGRIAQLTSPGRNLAADALVEDIFLAALGRFPSAGERKNSLAHLRQSANRTEGAQDLLWALINSPAFLFNR